MLKISGVDKNYKVGNKEIIGVSDANIEIGEGEFVSILGRSGCGKTTLLNCISGIDRISNGSITLNGEEISGLSDDEYAALRAHKIGYVFQNYNLIEHMSAVKNVQMALNHTTLSKREKKDRALKSLELVGMRKYANKRPGRLSGGEKQRVAIARALVSEPELILADEPTGALDSVNSDQIMKLLKNINETKKIAIVMVTHNESLARETDRVITMADGKVISDEKFVEQKLKEDLETEKTNDRISNKKLKTREAVGLAIHNTMAKKRRTFILALSTSIGIAGVMLVMGIGLGTKTRINREFEKGFNRNIISASITDSFAYKEDVTEQILAFDNVEAVYPKYSVDLYAGSGDKECSISGIYEETKESITAILTEGELPVAENEILTSETLAKKLTGKSGKQAIGAEVELTFLVKPKSKIATPVSKTFVISGIGETAMFGVLDTAYIPNDSLEKIAGEAGATSESGASGYCVILANSNNREDIIESLYDMGLDAKQSEELPSKFLGAIDVIVAILAFISFISVIVSAVMICLISYMNVTERTKEIGILKALGYQRDEIVKVFLSEGTIVGILAGMIGIGVAAFLGNVINRVFISRFSGMNFLPYEANGLYLIICIAASMMLGTICSKSAASKAAKLDPLKALGYVK
ncbi:ABC transporter ATP-binding protein/permease [Butyrivibrio sp. YAB3001]|uniref:ABC transporter ATP-binding protein/permease n=1 Tax=Butyrivibrio sp. YAB3001 TaxID=1520812 RepID=UPI0008F6854C|nr:ABC transporter ATP-binding protein/permease [Butyrivibrio sp. YAB3001]SFC11159.1 ABC-type lipoprotein export system, ATPase component [Butyrivibrio sp. YAB3001]